MRPDPLGQAGGINLYPYVLNNPVNSIDPFGLQLAEAVSRPEAIPLLPLLGEAAIPIVIVGGGVYGIYAVATGKAELDVPETLVDPCFGDGDDGDGGDRDKRCRDATRRCLARFNPEVNLEDLVRPSLDNTPGRGFNEKGLQCLQSMVNCLYGLTTIFPGGEIVP